MLITESNSPALPGDLERLAGILRLIRTAAEDNCTGPQDKFISQPASRRVLDLEAQFMLAFKKVWFKLTARRIVIVLGRYKRQNSDNLCGRHPLWLISLLNGIGIFPVYWVN